MSGFLLGYVAMLPLIGRIADLRGRVPVLVAALVVFALGSLVTALAYDMPHAWSPAASSRASAAAGWSRRPWPWSPTSTPPSAAGSRSASSPPSRRSAASLGPLFGAVVLAVADWRAIFLVNLAVGLVLAAAIQLAGRQRGAPAPSVVETPAATAGRRFDWLGLLLALVTLVAGALVFVQPSQLMRDLDLGPALHPVHRRRPLADPARRDRDRRAAAARGPLLHRPPPAARPPRTGSAPCARPTSSARCCSALALAGVILAFATADPKVQVFSDQGLWYLLGAALAAVAFVLHLRRADRPARAARRAAPYARLGRDARQLLRRRRADRGAHRHPALRADDGLPRAPS